MIDQHHLAPASGGGKRTHQTCGASANDYNVSNGHSVFPRSVGRSRDHVRADPFADKSAPSVPFGQNQKHPENRAFVGANLFAKGPVCSPKIYRLNYRLREQAKRRPVRPTAFGQNPKQPRGTGTERGNDRILEAFYKIRTRSDLPLILPLFSRSSACLAMLRSTAT
ncbi:hypothetical protein ALO54_102521 [Pseudomonas syringae pv. philadelphi]|nr:hypothetical protein ALO87_102565 [Pseudomonas syringae pv. apii]KPW58084.1 hypothetical protein ALO86_102265 [Pseudomonas syringae pv. berberidis]KPY18967.1 hypothetical protein ALO54_102521 [Pseudomonas syringae pv. philadelphi]RMM19247.1 hypothetical protein ALQ83_102587 [Pseudomonas syringae pv. berberidis]RMP67547.1 hypothetical protein ALQ19_102595 [Pseudomonas syringae pv. berberidis]